MGYQYTAIGDSLTTGFGALPGNGFVPVYRRMAEGRLRTTVASTNLGVNGMTTSELEQRLRGNSMMREAVREADIITVSIGGNDLIHAAKSAARQQGNLSAELRRSLQECKQNFSAIMNILIQLKARTRRPFIIKLWDYIIPILRWLVRQSGSDSLINTQHSTAAESVDLLRFTVSSQEMREGCYPLIICIRMAGVIA